MLVNTEHENGRLNICLLQLLQKTFTRENAEINWREGEAQERFGIMSQDYVGNFFSYISR